jgi:hypothetical protein
MTPAGKSTQGWVAGLLFLMVSAPARAQVHMEDTLRGGTTAGNPLGGTFTADGWRVDARTDRIWFALPTHGPGGTGS